MAKIYTNINELYEAMNEAHSGSRKLRNCQATVGESENFYFLWSYDTNVAVIDKRTDTLYDFLREVYGYTATSAQHIGKFSQDYGCGKWGCEHRVTFNEDGSLHKRLTNY